MATFFNSYTFDMTVLANYQALMGDIYDQIVTLGWVRTSDTGQTDPALVGSLPASSDYTSNYSIYRTNDGLTDIYLKVAFARSSSINPALGITIGTGSNGSGTITGNVTALNDVICGDTASGRHFYMSGDSGWLGFTFSPVAGTNSATAIIERSLSSAGANTSAEATLFFASIGGNGQHTIAMSGSSPTGDAQTNWRVACPRPASGSSWTPGGGKTGTAFAVPMGPNYGANPSLRAGVWRSDLVADTTAVIPNYGSNHTYLVSGQTADDAALAKVLMLYE